MPKKGSRIRSEGQDKGPSENPPGQVSNGPVPSPETGKGASLESAAVEPSPRDARVHSEGGAAAWGKARKRVSQVRSEVDDVHGNLSLYTNVKGERERADSQVRTRFGATLLRRADVNPWDEEAQRVYPDPTDYLTSDEVTAHKKAFEGGAHAMISDWAHENAIRSKGEAGYDRPSGGFGGLGAGSNFVGTIPEADGAMEKAITAHNTGAQEHAATRSLEETYALNQDQWKSDDEQIYRYTFHNLDKEWGGARIPRGDEFGADRNKWIAGGKTGSGAMEATIDSVTTEQMKDKVQRGQLNVDQYDFAAAEVGTKQLTAEDLNRKKEKRS